MAQTRTYGARGKLQVRAYPEAASQSFKKGDFLTVDSNGRAQLAAAAGSSVGATTATLNNLANRIIGRAEADASGTTGKMLPVLLVEGSEFLLPVWHGTPSSAVPNTNQIGKTYELKYVSGSPNYWAIDISATTNPKFKITDMQPGALGHDGWDGSGYPTAASTVQYGVVWGTFIDDFSAAGDGVYA